MARTVTLSQLRTDARLFADERPGSADSYISTTELDRFINLRLAGLYDLLVQARGHDHYRSEDTITTANGTERYALPSDFYQLLDVQIEWSSTQIEELRDFHLRDAGRLKSLGWRSYSAPRYRVEGSNLRILPVPTAVHTIRFGYIPVCPTLSDPTDTFDGINGWEVLVTVGAAIDMLSTQELSNAKLDERYAKEERRVIEEAGNRAAMSAPTIWDESPDDGHHHYLTRDWRI